jgi:hypothetical protein
VLSILSEQPLGTVCDLTDSRKCSHTFGRTELVSSDFRISRVSEEKKTCRASTEPLPFNPCCLRVRPQSVRAGHEAGQRTTFASEDVEG